MTYKQKVLFVDDEKPLRSIMSLMLDRLGYEPTVCSSSQEAIQAYQKHGPYHVAILDQNLDGDSMNGEDLFYALKAIDPQLYAILCTGFATEFDEPKNGFKGILTKPFEMGKLETMLKKEQN